VISPNSGQDTDYPELRCFFQSLEQNVGIVLLLGHDFFLANNYQSLIHLSPYDTEPWSWQCPRVISSRSLCTKLHVTNPRTQYLQFLLKISSEMGGPSVRKNNSRQYGANICVVTDLRQKHNSISDEHHNKISIKANELRRVCIRNIYSSLLSSVFS
jgi:hypothetical protein